MTYNEVTKALDDYGKDRKDKEHFDVIVAMRAMELAFKELGNHIPKILEPWSVLMGDLDWGEVYEFSKQMPKLHRLAYRHKSHRVRNKNLSRLYRLYAKRKKEQA